MFYCDRFKAGKEHHTCVWFHLETNRAHGQLALVASEALGPFVGEETTRK